MSKQGGTEKHGVTPHMFFILFHVRIPSFLFGLVSVLIFYALVVCGRLMCVSGKAPETRHDPQFF